MQRRHRPVRSPIRRTSRLPSAFYSSLFRRAVLTRWMCYNLRPRNRRMDEQIQIDSATPAANLWRGLFFGVLAGVTYGPNPAFALPLYAHGFSPDSVLCYRYALGTLLLGLGMAA